MWEILGVGTSQNTEKRQARKGYLLPKEARGQDWLEYRTKVSQ